MGGKVMAWLLGSVVVGVLVAGLLYAVGRSPAPDDAKPPSGRDTQSAALRGRVVGEDVRSYATASLSSRTLGTYGRGVNVELACWQDGPDEGKGSLWYRLAEGGGYVPAVDVQNIDTLPACGA
ncbi:hypothetical protein AB0N09_34630 [Streptomyces erythrochromogenes]|uniref:hypothetical protein n=1 Tax=Streptomyces erythrochromogenes TaxID=285574 RepID=UPI00341E182C